MIYSTPEKYETHALVSLAAKFHGLPESLVHAVVEAESRYDCTVTGKAGEIGAMQIKPSTAFLIGYAGSVKGLYDCTTNIFFGSLYLKRAYESCGHNIPCTISRYNRGVKARPQTKAPYVKKVERNLGAWVK